ncbi:MAG: DUF305 domain-containing protein [Actinomycetes bacterium]|jgi:hypothetical protein
MSKPYLKLAIALTASFVVMFAFSLIQSDQWSHAYPNLSNLYISVIGVSAMGVIMLVVMWGMYPSRRLNIGLLAGFTGLFFTGIFFARTEAFVGNDAFLYSMIPHHSRAILVCEEASITDPEIERLCDQIVEAQLDEIAQMQRMLDE